MGKKRIILAFILTISLSAFLRGQNITEKSAKADSLVRVKNYESAAEIYNQLLEQYPKDVDLRLNLGKVYFYAGHYEKAAYQLNEVIKQTPKYEDAYQILANVYFASNNKTKAISVLEKLYDVNPERKDLLFKIFLVSTDIKDYPTARKYYNKIKNLDDDIKLPEQYIRKILQWQIDSYFGIEFINNRSNWQDFTLGTSYKFDNNVTIVGNYQKFKRFDKKNDLVSLSTYFTFPQKVGWYINAGLSPKPDFLPKERIDVTVQPYLPEGFSLLGSFSYLITSDNNVSIFSAGMEKYIIPEVTFSYQYISGIIKNTDQKSHSHLLKLHWYKDNFNTTLGFSKGSELWDSPNTLFSFSINTYSIFMNSNIWLSGNTAINVNLAYTDRINNYTQRRIGAGFVYKF